MADHAHPVALQQRLDDVGRHRDAADILDVAARDRLAIGDQRQRFEQRAAVFLRLLLPQARDPRRHFLDDLEAEAARHFAQLEAAIRGLQAYRRQCIADRLRRRTLVVLEQRGQIFDSERLTRGEQCTLDDPLQQVGGQRLRTGGGRCRCVVGIRLVAGDSLFGGDQACIRRRRGVFPGRTFGVYELFGNALFGGQFVGHVRRHRFRSMNKRLLRGRRLAAISPVRFRSPPRDPPRWHRNRRRPPPCSPGGRSMPSALSRGSARTVRSGRSRSATP